MSAKINAMKPRLALLIALVAGAALMRLVPHPPNFTPIAALALFAGAHFESPRVALAVPLVAMLVSDVALQMMHGTGLHSALFAVYLSFVAVVGIGLLLNSRRRPAWILAAALASSTLFFVVTNFAVWAQGSMYPLTPEGLMACYIAAIPFFGWTVAGDLFYTTLLFGSFALAERRFALFAPRAAA